MKHYSKLIYIFSCILSFNCIGRAAYEQELNNNYYLLATDVNEDMHIGYKDGEYGIGIIDEAVFAVGQCEDFIIVKQHPRNFPKEVNKLITNYYIIPLKNRISKSIEKNIYGPLTLKEFKEKVKQLNIKQKKFTILFKDLE